MAVVVMVVRRKGKGKGKVGRKRRRPVDGTKLERPPSRSGGSSQRTGTAFRGEVGQVT